MEEKKEKQQSEVDSGLTVYDLNKQLVNQLDNKFSKTKIRDTIKNCIIPFLSRVKASYYMLLCHEARDYTIFSLHDTTLESHKTLSNELIECLANRGDILSIEVTEDKNALEIWINTEEDTLCYYFFNYEMGVIEI